MEPHVKAAAVYCRISQDRDGTMLGVERQERLCAELAERKGWPVAETYIDNDVSAYTGKPRPSYGRLLADLHAGLRDAVLVVDTDRLTRTPAELETFIDLADRRGVALANVSGDLDLSTSDGRFRARIMGAVARQESEKKSERIRRQREQAALAGRPHPGPRAFGYEPGGEKIRTAEAKRIRKGAADVLSGRSIRSVADEWNAAGVKTARGNEWTVNAVRDLLTSPRVAALRRHKGEVVGEASWPAILDRETHERLAALAKSRKRGVGRPPTRLLSGIAVCALCKHAMRSSGIKGASVYACRRQPGKGNGGNCGRLSILADALDDEIRDQLLYRLGTKRLADALERHRQDDAYRDLSQALSADEDAMEELSKDFYVDRLLSRREFLRARQDLERRITATRATLDAAATSQLLAGLPADEDGLRVWWDKAEPPMRRQLVELWIERVTIKPLDVNAPRRFDPKRAKPKWRA